MLIEGEMGMGMWWPCDDCHVLECRVSMLGVLMKIGGDGPSRMAGHAMIDEPMYLGGNPTR
jgi:hypothetical protein